MPLRLNLLAETQALEDMRRRDPVKRAIWVGVFLGVAILLWSSSLQLKAMILKGELNGFESKLAGRTNEFLQVLENQKKLGDVNQKLAALTRLATNRFLNGTMLDALQHTTVQDVQLVRLKTEHSYLITEETKQKTNSTGKVTTPAKPATFTEKIVLTLDAKDTSATPGDQVNKYKEAIADCGYFQHALGKTNEVRLRDLGTPQPPGPDGKPFMPFTLECRYPEKTR
jgi:hypothetical protein